MLKTRRVKEYAYLGERNVKLEIMLNEYPLAVGLMLIITSLLLVLKKYIKIQEQ